MSYETQYQFDPETVMGSSLGKVQEITRILAETKRIITLDGTVHEML